MKKSLLLAALLSLCLVSCGDNETSNNSSSSNSSTIVKPSNEGNYYSSVLNLEGEELYNGLHNLMTDYEFVSYSSLGSYYVDTDSKEDNGQNKMVDFYTHGLMSIPSDEGFGGEYNREHVWPRSLFSDGKGKGSRANSDLQHVRPDYYELNSKRGNCEYGNVEGTTEISVSTKYSGTISTGCYKSGNVFEPNDVSKGDCARICLYVAVTHNFDIRDVFAGSDDTIKQTLIEWNTLDPVDEIEIKRNDEAYKIQKNRNAFIDHNELFEKVVNTIL